MTEYNGKVKFLWQGWREPYPLDRIDKLYSIIVDWDYAVEVLEETLEVIEREYF